jgi:pilus assembly protein Flp/PilA
MEAKKAGSTRSDDPTGGEAGAMQPILTFLRGEEAVTAIEYGFVIGMISTAAVVAMTAIGTTLNAWFTDFSNAF